ncbi:hypothetical protein ABW21_db0209517 [Orbilia brochopaga]|nr:hypothetical protein ABW21_db0209517 [Drechslerella brochopaga]
MPPQRRLPRARSAPGRLQVGPYNRRTSPEPRVSIIALPPRITVPPPAPHPTILLAPTLEACPQTPQAPSRDAELSNEGPIPSRMPWDVRMFVREQRLNNHRENAAAGGPLLSSPFLLSDEREASPMRSRDSRQRASSLPREVELGLRRVRKGGVTKKSKAKSKTKSKLKAAKKPKTSRGKVTRPSRKAATSQMTAQAPESHPLPVPNAPSNPAPEGDRAGDESLSPHAGRLARPTSWLERLGEITMQRTQKGGENKENKEPRQRGTLQEAIRVREQSRRSTRRPRSGLNGQNTGDEGRPRVANGNREPERRVRGTGSARSSVQPRRGNDEVRGRSMARGSEPVDVAPTVQPPRMVTPVHESQLPYDRVLLTGSNIHAEMAFRRDLIRLNQASDRNFNRVQEQQTPAASPQQYIHPPRQGLSEIPNNVLNGGPVQVRGRQVAQGTAIDHQRQEDDRRRRELLRRALFRR